MTDENATTTAASDASAPPSVFDELSSFLLWLSKRWPGLGFAGLTLAMLLWVDFIRLFDLPVSFISPGLLPALPILGLAVGVPAAAGIVIAALMAFVLWQPLHPGGPSLVSAASLKEQDATAVSGRIRRPDPFMRWVMLLGVHALYWIAYVLLVAAGVEPQAGWVWALGLVIPGAYAYWSFWPVFRAATPTRPSWGYLGFFTGSLFMQSAFAGLLFLPLVASAGGGGSWGMLAHMEGYFLMMVGVAFIQLVTAKLALRGWRRGLLRKVFLAVAVLLVPVLAYPDVGGTFASYRLRLSGPGHASCMVLVFRQGQSVDDAITASVLDGRDRHRSIALNFVARFDDQYYVKAQPYAGPTWLVPVSAVGGVESCPNKLPQ